MPLAFRLMCIPEAEKTTVRDGGRHNWWSRVGNSFPTTAVAFGTVGFVMVWYATSLYGVGVTPDSVRYLSAAQSFLGGHGFTLYNGQPMVTSPPLYPLLLAVLGFFGMSVVGVAQFLNAALFGLVIVVADLWMMSRFTWRVIADLTVLGILLSPALIEISSHAWTEPLFVLLVLVFLILLERTDTTHTWRQTIILGVVVGLACLTRYVGVLLVPYCLLALILSSDSWWEKFRKGAAFCALALVPLALWLARNYVLTETLTGNRQTSSFPVSDILGHTASVLADWYYHFGPLDAFLATGTVAVIVLAALSFIWSDFRRGKEKFHTGRRLLVTGFAPYYIFCLVMMALITDFDRVSSRLLSPICIPLLVVVFSALDNLASGDRKRGFGWRKIAVLGICAVWLSSLLIDTGRRLADSAENGAGGYAKSEWQNSEIVKYVKTKSLPGTLYTNGPDVIYLLTGRHCRLSPRKSGPSLSGDRLGLDEFKALVAEEGAIYLAWFHEMGRPYLYSPKDLSSQFVLQPIRRVSDGTLYRALPIAPQ